MDAIEVVNRSVAKEGRRWPRWLASGRSRQVAVSIRWSRDGRYTSRGQYFLARLWVVRKADNGHIPILKNSLGAEGGFS